MTTASQQPTRGGRQPGCPGRQSVGRSHGRSLLVGGRQPSGIRQCVCLVSVTLSVALSVRVVLFVCTYISMYSIHLTNEHLIYNAHCTRTRSACIVPARESPRPPQWQCSIDRSHGRSARPPCLLARRRRCLARTLARLSLPAFVVLFFPDQHILCAVLSHSRRRRFATRPRSRKTSRLRQSQAPAQQHRLAHELLCE